MKRILHFCFLLPVLAAVVITGNARASGLPQASEIDAFLLVGNSFTFYNNGIHNHIREMLLETEPQREPPHFIKSLTLSGGRLQDHTAGLQQTLQQWDWNVVVLQGHSLEAVDPQQLSSFNRSVDELSEMIRDKGAEPVLFMTWAYRDQAAMTGPLERAYVEAGRRNHSTVAPVGLAFAEALQHLPGEALIMDDGKHPTLAGTYLAACTLYATLFQRSPQGLAYTAGLPATMAAELQNSAWRAVIRSKGTHND